MNKRLIIIILAIVLLLTVAGGLYYYFSRQGVAPGDVVKSLFPSGGELPTTGQPGIFQTGEVPKEKPKLTQLTDVPIAGLKALERGRVRYAEKGTGHIYEVGGDGSDKIRISNTTIPRVFQTTWSAKGDYVIFDILTEDQKAQHFLASLTGTTTEGIFLPEDIQIGGFSAVNQVAYFAELGDRYAVVIADIKNQKPKEVYSSPFRDFLLKWPAADIISLATRPSGTIDGYLYKLDLKQNIFSKITGGINGLEALWSPDAQRILISGLNDNTGETFVFAINQKGENIVDLAKSLTAKCAWSMYDKLAVYCAIPESFPPALYPDDWYKGKVSFNDSIQKIYLSATSTEILLPAQNFDIEEMALDKKDEFLFFVNKNDETLWGLRLN
jgi:hypothetical protein